MERHTAEHIKVLLVEANPADARSIQEALQEVRDVPFKVEYANRLSMGLQRLADGDIDVLLLDLSLPDSQGLETFIKAHVRAPEVPIVVLSSVDDDEFALETVRNGAQDYLVKGQTDRHVLVRAVRYAIGRHQMQEELRSLSLIDDLTGLNNRRGFLLLAQQQLKMATRTKRPLLLLVADVDKLKAINDTLGHQEGNLALIDTARVLTGTFRESDIIARLSGDEFAALAIEAGADNTAAMTTRLQERLKARNAQADRRYTLSLSVGVALYDATHASSIEELMARADASMYEQKSATGKTASTPPLT